MDLFLFLITIYCLPLITTSQPFIDCAGKSFLCENSTHFKICVDVGGGVSMTVGNIILSCPPTTLCDENNAFECEYPISTVTTLNPVSEATGIQTETIEARLTTNVYDEFLFTSDSQQAEENIVFPTQQKYIIPGNANVIFEDADNAVLVYGNIDNENSTPVNEKLINISKNENINDTKNVTIEVNKKFTRRNKELTPNHEEARNERTITVQTTDTTDKLITTFSELPSDSVTTEQSFTGEYVTATKNIEISVTPSISIPDFGSNSINNFKNIIRNKDKLYLTTDSTVNRIFENELSSKIIQTTPFDVLKSNLTISDVVNNASTSLNISHADEIIKDKAKLILQQNQINLKNNHSKANEDTVALQSTTAIFTESTDVTFKLNIPTERYAHSGTYPKHVPTNSAARLIKTTTTPNESVMLNLNIPTERYVENYTSSKYIIPSKSTRHIVETSTTPSMITEKHAQYDTNQKDILSQPTSKSRHQFEAISASPNRSVISNPNTTERYVHNVKFPNNNIPLNYSGQQIKTISTVPNKAITSTSSTPPMGHSQNVTMSKDILFDSSKYVNETISTTPIEIVSTNLNTPTETYAPNNMSSRVIVLPDSLDFNSSGNLLQTTTMKSDTLGEIDNTILFEELVHPTETVENGTLQLSTSTKSYILNGIISNPNMPSDNSEFDITFGDILKIDKDTTDLKAPEQVHNTEKTILDSTIEPGKQESSKDSSPTSHNDSRTKLEYKNSSNSDVHNTTDNDTVTVNNYYNRNKNTSMAKIIVKVSDDASTNLNTEIITEDTMLDMKTINSNLNTNVETITQFTTEDISTLQQSDSYQTTLRSNNAEDTKNVYFEDTDYKVLLFPESTVETFVTDMSTTPKSFIQNDITSNPIIPNDAPDFDISFNDLIKGNKDFIELKSPLQISITDRPISDFTVRSENRESLRNFRSTAQNNSLNNDVPSNFSEKLIKPIFDISNSTKKISEDVNKSNITIIDENIHNKETVIVENESFNKDLSLNKTDNGLITTDIHKNIQDTNKITSPRYSLTNSVLNINKDNNSEARNIETNKTTDQATYLSEDENKIKNNLPKDDKNLFGNNTTVGNHNKLDEKDIGQVQMIVTAKSVPNDVRNDNKIIKRTDSELNDTLKELIYSTQSTTETVFNTEGTTVSNAKSEIKSADLIKTNKTDVVPSDKLEDMTKVLPVNNNRDMINKTRVMSTITESTLNISKFPVSINNISRKEATISNSVSRKDLAKDITEKVYATEVTTLSSSPLLDEIIENQRPISLSPKTKNALNAAGIHTGIHESIQDTLVTKSPKDNLNNHTRNVTSKTSAENLHTKSNETNNKVSLTVNEKGILDKLPISNVLQKNVTVGNSKSLNHEGNEGQAATDAATNIMDVTRKDKIIKRTDSKLINKTSNVSTQSTTETSSYLRNTDGFTLSYQENKRNISINNNTADLVLYKTRDNEVTVKNNSVLPSITTVTEPVLNTSNFTFVHLMNNFKNTVPPITITSNNDNQIQTIANTEYVTEVPIQHVSTILFKITKNQPSTEKSVIYHIENTTARTLQTPSNSNESTLEGTFVKTTVPISRSIYSKDQKTDFLDSPTVSTHHNEVPIVNSTVMTKNREENHLAVKDKRKEMVNEFTYINPENVTQLIIKNSILTTNSLINGKLNDGDKASGKPENNSNEPNNTKHNISHYSTHILITPRTTMTTENDHVTIITQSHQITSKSLSNNKETAATETSAYATNKKESSNKMNYQNTFYDAFVHPLNGDLKPVSQISTTTNKNDRQTTSSVDINKEHVTVPVNIKVIPKTSTFNVFNETNNSITNIHTSKVSFNGDGRYRTLQKNESVVQRSSAKITNETINKLKQENVNPSSKISVNLKEPVTQIQFNVYEVTTETIKTEAKLHELIKIDNVTESQNVKIFPVLKESKNESIIQKCSNRSICISQPNGQVAIELYNKTRINIILRNNTDSKTKDMKESHLLNTTNIILPNTEIESDSNMPIRTEQYNEVTTKKTNVKKSTDILKGVQEIYNLTSKNHELKRQIQNNSHVNVTIIPIVTTQNKDYKIAKKDEMSIKHQTTKSSLNLQSSDKHRTNISTETRTAALAFDCRNHSRGRYADKDNCRKFYICIGYTTPIVGFCPESTVFSEFKKQCTNNLSHCIRNNQFKCVKDGRFIDVWQDNMYYLCVKGPSRRFLRLKLQCKNGYILDKVNVICKQGKQISKSSSSTSSKSSSSSSSSSSGDKKRHNKNKKSNKKLSKKPSFKCYEEGKFVDPNNCRKYYVCSKTSKSVLRRKRKKCDSDEVFDDDKKECVDEDSYECK